MIRNGLYFYSSKALDGVVGGADGVMVLRDGKMSGGTQFFYFDGEYSCSGGRWKGELTDQEHTPAPAAGYPTAGMGPVTFGFNGTYTNHGAQFYATALVGKQSLQYHATFRLLVPD
jgi:T3SS negative regulator,GrlR